MTKKELLLKWDELREQVSFYPAYIGTPPAMSLTKPQIELRVNELNEWVNQQIETRVSRKECK